MDAAGQLCCVAGSCQSCEEDVAAVGDSQVCVEDVAALEDADIHGASGLFARAMDSNSSGQEMSQQIPCGGHVVADDADLTMTCADVELTASGDDDAVASGVDGVVIDDTPLDVSSSIGDQDVSSKPKKLGIQSSYTVNLDQSELQRTSSTRVLNTYPIMSLFLFALLTSPSFIIGFLSGCVPNPHKSYIQPFVLYIQLALAGPFATAWEPNLLKWTHFVWFCWAMLFAAPFHLTIRLATGSNESLTMVYILAVIGITGFTMPIPLAAMHMYKYQWSRYKEMLAYFAVVTTMLTACVLLVFACLVDSVWLSVSAHPAVKWLRPLILFLMWRIIHLIYSQALSHHPNTLFRSTCLVFMHITNGTLAASAAAKCKDFDSCVWLFSTTMIKQSVSLVFYGMGDTAILQKSRALRLLKCVWDAGKATPPPGVSKVQYRGLELTLSFLTVTSNIAGMLLSYVLALRWLQTAFSFLKTPMRFWYPHGDTSALYLLVFLVANALCNFIVYKLVSRKTGCSYRGVFLGWLPRSSAVGWPVLLLISATASFVANFLTYLSYSVEILQGQLNLDL